MARYRGPKTKKSRAFGESIYGYDKAFEKRKYGPGQHGNGRRRKQKSEYGQQLMEKQKAKFTYGVLERQFHGLYVEASRRKGVTGSLLMQLLESRLDNVVFRLGLAESRRQARQLVTHKHITVNGEICNIPSRLLVENDVIAVRERSKTLEVIERALEKANDQSHWLAWNGETMEARFVNYPERERITENIKEQLIVELYSK